MGGVVRLLDSLGHHPGVGGWPFSRAHVLIAASSSRVRPLPEPVRAAVGAAAVVRVLAFTVRSSSCARSSSALALVTFSSASRWAASVSRRSVSSARSAVMRLARLRTAAAGWAVAPSRSSWTGLEKVSGMTGTSMASVAGWSSRVCLRFPG